MPKREGLLSQNRILVLPIHLTVRHRCLSSAHKLYLSRLETLGRISAILNKGDNFYFFCTTIPFWKGIYSKSKEFAPIGSKFFPFRKDPFSKGRLNTDDRIALAPTRTPHSTLSITFIRDTYSLTLVLLNPDMPCFCKQCRVKSIWICTVCHF